MANNNNKGMYKYLNIARFNLQCSELDWAWFNDSTNTV